MVLTMTRKRMVPYTTPFSSTQRATIFTSPSSTKNIARITKVSVSDLLILMDAAGQSKICLVRVVKT